MNCMFENRLIELKIKNFDYIINDDEVLNIDENQILSLLSNCNQIKFEKAYYDEPCEHCVTEKSKQKFFEFLETNFFIFTKDKKFVISDISKEYENTSFKRLLKNNLIDDSYIVTLVLCDNCEKFYISIEQCSI